MEEHAKVAAVPFTGEADPVPQSLLASFPEQAKTLGLLYDVSRELTSILDREELLQRITALVKKIVNYDVFTVLLWNEKTEWLEGVFANHYADAIPSRFRVSLNEGITGHAAAEKRAIRVDDVLRDPRYLLCESCELVRSELVVPLLIQDRLIGVLDLESAELAAFTAQHERMLVALGPFIAIALENSRLYEEARENQLRLQNDLDTAKEIQLQLLPRGAREVPGFRAGPRAGGRLLRFLAVRSGTAGTGLGRRLGKRDRRRAVRFHGDWDASRTCG